MSSDPVAKTTPGNAVADAYALGFQAAEGDVRDLRRKLARAQAYNDCLTRHVISLIETVKAKGAPNAATIIHVCEESLRKAFRAGEEAGRG